MGIKLVPEKIHTHPMKGHQKFLGEGGVLKAQNFRSNMKLNWNFLGGGEVQNKNLPWGERATSFPGLFLFFKIFGEVLGTRLGEYGHFLELQIRQGFIWCRFSG